MANLLDLKLRRMACKCFDLLFSNPKYSLNVLETLISEFKSKLINGLGFLPNVSSYGLQFPKFGILNVLYANVAKANILATSVLSWLDVQ